MRTPIELSKGFHIATDTSKVTPTENGIFIPFGYGHNAMLRDLMCFLAKYFPEFECTSASRYIDLYTIADRIQSMKNHLAQIREAN